MTAGLPPDTVMASPWHTFVHAEQVVHPLSAANATLAKRPVKLNSTPQGQRYLLPGFLTNQNGCDQALNSAFFTPEYFLSAGTVNSPFTSPVSGVSSTSSTSPFCPMTTILTPGKPYFGSIPSSPKFHFFTSLQFTLQQKRGKAHDKNALPLFATLFSCIC